jgi:probable rRNA maturation factor
LAFAALETLAVGASPPAHWHTDPVELGDIVISLETALRQAPEHQHSPEQELAWLASHGLLHLLGWDHPDAASLEQMLAQQDNLLTSMNIL